MVLFEFLQLFRIFLDYLWVEYLWHALIMLPINRNGIIRTKWSFFTPFAHSREPELGAILIFQTVSPGSTLAITPRNTPQRLGLLQRPLRLFASHSAPTNTQKVALEKNLQLLEEASSEKRAAKGRKPYHHGR
jgi:hypothetical protein